MSASVAHYRSRRTDLVATPRDVFRERLGQRRVAKAGQQIDFFPWAMKVPEPKTGPLRFDLFPPQLELYQEGEHDREAVVMKGTQVGISAWAMRWSLFHADTKGYTGLYVFPTSKDMWDYSALRIKPLIDSSEHLLSRKKPDDPDNKGMKGIGLGMVVFRGSESKVGLDSVDADHIVFDEYDTLNQRNIPDAEMRVSSPLSPGLIRRVGVPIYPDDGIDATYHRSDCRRWMVKCGCGEWQDIDFFRNVDMETATRICRACKKPIDVSEGEWVAEFPDRETRGYHFNRLIIPSADLTRTVAISKKRSPSEKQVFMNKHLGIAWAPAEGRLTTEAIKGAQREYSAALRFEDVTAQGGQLVTMGVDVATVRDLNVRVSLHFTEDDVEKKKALFIGTLANFDQVATLMKIFNVHMCVIDHLPDGRLGRAVEQKFPGRVYLLSYDGTPTPRSAQVISVDDELTHVRVNRVAAIDATFDMIRQQRNLLPDPLPDGYIEQLRTPVKVIEEDEFGKKTVVYRSPRPDDFAHAEVFDLVAHDLYIRRQELNALMEPEIRQADDMLEFERSHLAELGEADYHAGPSDEEYHAIGDRE